MYGKLKVKNKFIDGSLICEHGSAEFWPVSSQMIMMCKPEIEISAHWITLTGFVPDSELKIYKHQTWAFKPMGKEEAAKDE